MLGRLQRRRERAARTLLLLERRLFLARLLLLEQRLLLERRPQPCLSKTATRPSMKRWWPQTPTTRTGNSSAKTSLPPYGI
jgi:hypothetical protein